MKRYSIDVWSMNHKHERTYSGNSNDLLATVCHINSLDKADIFFGTISHIRIRELNYQKKVKYYNRYFMEIPLSVWERLDRIQKISFMLK